MAAVVCQSQLVESRTLRLRLPSSKPIPSHSIDLALKSCFWDPNIKPHHEDNNNDNDHGHDHDTFQENPVISNPNTGSWSFLEALSNVSNQTKNSTSEKETIYVHPQQMRSSMVLSPKSLELCTENLGNESGTDIGESGIDMLCFGTGEQREEQPRQHLAAKKAKSSHNFPPPLTTIRGGSESLRVRPHRENGRLLIEVTKVPPSVSCFQAQRSHGRLRLCFLTNHAQGFDSQEEENSTTNEYFVEEEEFESEMIGQIQDDEHEETEKEEAEETEEEEETGEEEDVERECEGCDMRMEIYEMPRRCKEGGDNENTELLLNWNEPLWVATM